MSVKDATEGCLCLDHIWGEFMYLGNVDIPRSHQFPDVSIVSEKLILLVERYLSIVQQLVEIADFGIPSFGTQCISG